MTSPACSSPAACKGASEKSREEGSQQQSNKEEEQWRQWLASYQVPIPSSASLGLRSSVRLNCVSLTGCSTAICFQCWRTFISLSAMSAIRWSLLRPSSRTTLVFNFPVRECKNPGPQSPSILSPLCSHNNMHSKNQKRHSSPVPSRSPVVLMKAKVPAVASSPGDAFRIPKDYPHSRFSKAPLAVYPPKGARSKPRVSLPVVSLEKMPCLSRANSTSQVRFAALSSSPSSSPLKPTPSSEKLPNGRGNGGPSTPCASASPSSLDGRPSPARSPLDKRASPSPSPSPAPSHVPRPAYQLLSSSPEKKNQNGTKASFRSHNRLSGRVFDPNKHCGVPDPETKQPCTRSLTCKAHSLTHRRAVPGRRKHFDVLLAEHRSRNKETEGAKEKDKDSFGMSATSQDVAGTSKPPCLNGRPLSTLKLKLANAHIPGVPGIPTAAPQPPPPPPAPNSASNPEPSPHPWTTTSSGDGERLSSDEGDAQTPEDAHRPAFHFSNVHPRPSGFCIFSSRQMGRGYYVFDRRWDRMRLALQNMVEKHLNAQMWRKVPLAAESLPSLSSTQKSPLSDTCALLTNPSSSVSSAHFSPHPSPSRNVPRTISHHSSYRASHITKEREDSLAGTKRKNSSCSIRNGTNNHLSLQAPGGAVRKKGRIREGNGLWGYNDHWLSKADGSHGHNSNSSDLGNTGISYSSGRELVAAPSSGALNYGRKVEEKKRKSTYQGKTDNKLSRLDAVDAFFGNDSEPKRQHFLSLAHRIAYHERNTENVVLVGNV
ncbi:ataxin-7-like protein 1 isoform X2 [Corythoichthys intestinalis]|uniref:ataxin-7-like protein 1 isoform X2 n=1 Tax=Corythoichthys intestinalis TaxID=161448 RepID=UPI0025A54739|nr:ataxin-7-like protein 1 isoform X2 [Corythoichthys intestinalis]